MIRFFAPVLFVVAALSTQAASAQQKNDTPAKNSEAWATSQAALVNASSSYPHEAGMQIAPGLTAAPPHRVQFDYRGRPMGKGLAKRLNTVEPAAPVAAVPAEPVLTASAAPVPVAPAPVVAVAAPKVAAPKAAAPKKSAPVSKPAAKSSGWDTGGW